jgi:hypothetical protein
VRRLVRILSVAAVAVIAAGALLLVGAYQAAKQEPEFYRQALSQQPQQQKKAGFELEQQVLELHNETRQDGRWQAVFTAEQINGWLAADLPDKFPKALPRGVTDPRVAIDPEQAQIACRYDDDKLSTVVSLAVELHLTEEPNVIAVRICQARAGVLPIPLKQWLDRISTAAQRSNLPLRWSQRDGDPVALVTVPTEHKDYAHRFVRLDTLELREGAIYLAGRTERASGTEQAARADKANPPKTAAAKTGHQAAIYVVPPKQTAQR